MAETGSSETWHGRLGPRITHPDLLLLLLDDCSSQASASATGPVPRPPAAGSLVPRQGPPPQACPTASHARRRRRNRGDLGAEFPSARGGIQSNPIRGAPARARPNRAPRPPSRFSSRLLRAPAVVSWRRVGVGLRRKRRRGGEEEVEDWGTPPRAEASGERERERGTGEETGQRTLWVGVI